MDDKSAFESKVMRRRCTVGTDWGATWVAKTHTGGESEEGYTCQAGANPPGLLLGVNGKRDRWTGLLLHNNCRNMHTWLPGNGKASRATQKPKSKPTFRQKHMKLSMFRTSQQLCFKIIVCIRNACMRKG